jgi:hypothetical protein
VLESAAMLAKAATTQDLIPVTDQLERAFDQAFGAVRAFVQPPLDRALGMPTWLLLIVLAVSVALLLLHRHGQRPLSALALGALSAFAILRWLPLLLGPEHDLAPGVLAVLSVGMALGVGVVFPGLATGLVGAVAGALLGGAISKAIADDPSLGAIPAGLLAGFFGFVGHRALGLWLPPIFTALGFSLALAWTMAVPWRAPSVSPLPRTEIFSGAGPFLLLWAVLAVVLVAVSLERERRARLRQQVREERAAQEERERQRELAERAFDRSLR